MATGDRVMTSWQFQHEMIEAAQERGWEVTRMDARQGITLEEPIKHGIVLNVSGYTLSPAFIRTLPEAHQPAEHESGYVDGPLELRLSRADPNRNATTQHRGGERS